MPTLSLFNWASLVAAITVMGMAFILVPEAAWTIPVFLSIGLFVLAVAFLFYATSLIASKRSAGDAGQLASISLVANLRYGGHDLLLAHLPYTGDRGPDRYPQYRLADFGAPLIHGHLHDPLPV